MSFQESSRWTKTQLVVFFVLFLLSIDEVNPVKIVLHVFPSIKRWQIGSCCIIFMVYIFISDLKAMLYFMCKIFFHSILSIFFRSVEIIGRENIPKNGPVIYTINHANQFIDAVMVVCSSPLPVSYLMAEASFQRRVIGDIAWALGVVPVRRAQDSAKTGSGTIVMKVPIPAQPVTDADKEEKEDEQDKTDNQEQKEEKSEVSEKVIHVVGFDTKFLEELVPGDKIRPPGTAYGLKVKTIESNASMILDGSSLPSDFPMELFDASDRNDTSKKIAFDVLKRTPLTTVFEKVLDRLAARGAVGIFPEGGSHDRTDLLPLKVGIALIAYSALEKDGINVPVVPVGLNYFRAHRWRGRAVVEYGKPVAIDSATLKDFKAGGEARRNVCNAFLETIEDAMRSVIVSAPDYETLELIHTARRLYRRKKLGAVERQELSRRFVEGYRRLLQQNEGKVPPQWQELQERIKDYRNELKELGIKDYQVQALAEEKLDANIVDGNHVDPDKILSGLQVPYHIIHFLILLCVSAVPSLLLNLPVGVMAGLYSESRRKKALANSKVKVRGFDVMLSEKVFFCIVMVPTLWLMYGIVLTCFTNLDGPTIALIMGIMPLFAYTGIIVADAGMVDLQDLRPYVMRAFPSTRKKLAALPQKRKKLRDDLRLFVKTMGPSLGDIYYGKKVDWQTIRRSSSFDSRASDYESEGEDAKKTK